ncbi:MAG TPA: beta-galactosidase, partial [Erysipelotrichaceae bacterium]|nr:beta-galactosidase [Erysipelotrichaceae bacterium]
FIWTGWDYLGEPEPWNGLEPGSVSGQGASPKSSYFGVVDTAGFEKDTYYFYMSQWNPDVVTLHILPDWNVEDIVRDKLGRVKVDVYSNAASVELFRNGMSLGRKYFANQTTEDGYTYQTCEGELYLSWDVWYWPGEITAKAYDEDGNEITDTVGRSSVKTSSAAAQVVLTADRSELRADVSDLAFITAEIRDEDGNPVDGASVDLNFTLEGEGRSIGVDNGDPTDLSSYQGSDESHASRRTFSGKALIIVQTSKTAGTIRMSASGEGLASSVIEINSAAP